MYCLAKLLRVGDTTVQNITKLKFKHPHSTPDLK